MHCTCFPFEQCGPIFYSKRTIIFNALWKRRKKKRKSKRNFILNYNDTKYSLATFYTLYNFETIEQELFFNWIQLFYLKMNSRSNQGPKWKNEWVRKRKKERGRKREKENVCCESSIVVMFRILCTVREDKDNDRQLRV